jgi:hypothetical protein
MSSGVPDKVSAKCTRISLCFHTRRAITPTLNSKPNNEISKISGKMVTNIMSFGPRPKTPMTSRPCESSPAMSTDSKRSDCEDFNIYGVLADLAGEMTITTISGTSSTITEHRKQTLIQNRQRQDRLRAHTLRNRRFLTSAHVAFVVPT